MRYKLTALILLLTLSFSAFAEFHMRQHVEGISSSSSGNPSTPPVVQPPETEPPVVEPPVVVPPVTSYTCNFPKGSDQVYGVCTGEVLTASWNGNVYQGTCSNNNYIIVFGQDRFRGVCSSEPPVVEPPEPDISYSSNHILRYAAGPATHGTMTVNYSHPNKTIKLGFNLTQSNVTYQFSLSSGQTFSVSGNQNIDIPFNKATETLTLTGVYINTDGPIDIRFAAGGSNPGMPRSLSLDL